jgi:hypothetical protein
VRATFAVARDNNVKSAYFIQPAPAIGKELTEEEKRVVGDLSYRDIYRNITAGLMTLRDGGAPVFDLTQIFAGEKATIYADHIHYARDANQESLGNRIIAARMGEILAEAWGFQRKP